jgi:ATP-dependent Clp protease protease subunit
MTRQPSAGVGASETDIAIQAEMLRSGKREIAELIAGHTGQTVDRISADFDRDRWFSATEAQDYGFIGRVISRLSS